MKYSYPFITNLTKQIFSEDWRIRRRDQLHNFFLIIQMIPQKVLHNSNDPITSISFGADFEEEEDLEEVELI